MNIYEVNTFTTLIHSQYIEAESKEEALKKLNPSSLTFDDMDYVSEEYEVWLHKENIKGKPCI